MASEACTPFNSTAPSQVVEGGRLGLQIERCSASQRKRRIIEWLAQTCSNYSALIDQRMDSSITLTHCTQNMRSMVDEGPKIVPRTESQVILHRTTATQYSG